MADPPRLLVQKALAQSLEAIHPGATEYAYQSDLRPSVEVPRRVFRGRAAFDDNDPIPMVSILEVPVPLEPGSQEATNVTGNGEWELILQGWAKDDPVDPTDPAQYLMADIKARLAFEKERDRGHNILGFAKGQVVHSLKIGSGVVRPPDDISTKAYFWLNITLGLVENWRDPYKLGIS